jgi:hypothetical protein
MAEPTRLRLLAAAGFFGLFAWLFCDVLFLPNSFAFRDAGHFYHPLFEFVGQEWAAGRLPLWNPYEASGEPLLANSTSSVLYPGKLIFALPMSFAAAYKSYILAHLVLAGGMAYLLARRWGNSVAAAALCGMSYAFSGQILFQVYNVVFLCATAWLPLAVLAGDAMLVTRHFRYALGLGIALALMVLGGDPQLAYEAGLLVALGALLYWRADRKQRMRPAGEVAASGTPTNQSSPVPWYRRRPVLLAAAACWTLALSAAQMLPTAELSRLSDRAHFDLPRSLAEIPAYLARDFDPPPRFDGSPPHWFDAMIGRHPAPHLHSFAMYDFSVNPLRVAEWIWPNFSGDMIPVNRRWLGALTGDKNFWTPSLYMGLLPFLLALVAWRVRGADPRTAWLSWMVVIGLVGSFGSFAVGWLVRQAFDSKAIGDEVGGLYWLLTVLLPGFAQFRYPAKLVTLAALGLSLLAALGWSQFAAGKTRGLLRLLTAALLTSALGLAVVAAVAPFWDRWLPGYSNDFFGPLQTELAYWSLVRSLVHTFVLSALLLASIRWLWPTRPPLERFDMPQRTAAWLLLLTAMDLAIAQRGMVVAAPSSLWQGKPALANLIDEADQRRGPQPDGFPQPYRLLGLYEPLTEDFATTSSPQRVVEGVRRERAGMEPKYALPQRYAIASGSGTIEQFDYQLFTSPLIQPEPREYTQSRRAFDALGVKYFLLPVHSKISTLGSAQGLENEWLEPRWSPERPQLAPQGPPLPPAVEDASRWLGPLSQHVKVVYNESYLPRARIVRDLYVTAPIASANRGKLMPMLETLLFPYDQWLDMRTAAWVEEEGLLPYTRDGWLLLPKPAGEESCRIVRHEPQRVEIEAELGSPGLVLLADLYYPGWQLTVETDGQTQPGQIVRANRIMRGALVPAGKHRLIYEYRPQSFYLGAGISTAGWLAALCVAAALLVGLRRRRGLIS